MSSRDTILALATPPGRSGVAVIRVSGADLTPTIEGLALPLLTPRRATLVALHDSDSGELIDRGLALHFPAPNSFTGEDVLELQLHGSQAVVRDVIGLLLRLPNHRMADAGEFTRRAFEAGKLDLDEAEGLADLIDAETTLQRRQALRQMEGALGRVSARLREQLLDALAYVEALIDFAEEDLPGDTQLVAEQKIASVRSEIETLLANAQYGERIRDGFRVVLMGEPNVGKSSLLNYLAGRDVAIVSPEAGTTRDLLEVKLDLDGLPVWLIDTAGLREQAGVVEQEGIRRALAAGESADLILELSEAGSDSRNFASSNRLSVATKVDLRPANSPRLAISTIDGTGIPELLQTIRARLSRESTPVDLTRERHKQLYSLALSDLGIEFVGGTEILAYRLRSAIQRLAEITGEMTTDDLLDTIFSRFCLGK